MTKIVSTIGSSHRIEQVISEAREYIVIVTPYLKITNPLLSRLGQADKRNVKISLLYGKNDISSEQREKLLALQNLNLYYLKDLHAKCYLNEQSGLLSSMNLYEYSQVNNWELGVSYDEDDTIFRDQLLGEIELMLDSAEVKIENFKRFELIKKRYVERLTEFLNDHFKTDKFRYERDEVDFFDEYLEEITCKGFPNEYLDIEISNDGTRIDFILNISQNKTEEIKSKVNFKMFSDEYRVYQNAPDRISMYHSIFHRDKWDTYSDKFCFEYIAKGIERMSKYIDKIVD